MLSSYEATTDPVFPPFNFVEFPLEFGRGPYLKHPYDIVCVEIDDVHCGVLKVEVAGLMLPYILLPRIKSATRIPGTLSASGTPGTLERTENYINFRIE